MKKMMIVFMSALLLFFASVSFAGEADSILKLLIKKGVITEAEYSEIKEELKAEAKEPDRTHLKEEIKKEVMAEVEKKKEAGLPEWTKRIKLSGLLEGEYRWKKYRDISNKNSDSTSDLYLRKLELGLEAELTDWIKANTVLNSEWIGDSVNNGDQKITVDEATITLQKEKFPLYLVMGKRTQPFGTFYNRLVTDPMTQDAYETKRVGLTAGFTGPMGLDISATLYKGEELMAHLFGSGLFDAAAIRRPSDVVTVRSATTDDVNSYILGAQFMPIKDALTFGLSYASEDGHQKRNTTLGANLQYNCLFIKGLTLEAEYMAALQREKYIDSAGALFNKAFKEKVWVLGASYPVIEPLDVAIRYEHFDDDGMANVSQSWSAKDRYSLGGQYTFYKDEEKGLSAFVGAEYRHTDYRLHSSHVATRADDNDEMFVKVGVNF